MGLDHFNSGKLGMVIVMMVVSVVSIVLRFWSRAVVLKCDYRWDDWFALFATFVFLGQLGLEPVFIANGIGKDITELTPDQLTTSLKAWLVAGSLNILGLTFSKLSVLVFYVRIFGFRSNVNIFWRFSVSVAVFLTLAYVVWLAPVSLTTCRPVQKLWHPLVPGNCRPSSVLFVSSAAYSVVVDLLILLLPLLELTRLKMKRSKKAILAVAFAIGYCVPAVTIGRLVTVLVSNSQFNTNFTRAFGLVGFWFQAEPGITLFAISTPPMLQLYLRGAWFGLRSLFTSCQYSQTSDRTMSDSSFGESSFYKDWRARFITKHSATSDPKNGSQMNGHFLVTRKELGLRAAPFATTNASRVRTMPQDNALDNVSDRTRMQMQCQATYDV